jgi:hypothetical protein
MGSFLSQLVYLAMKLRDAIKNCFLRRAVGVEELRYEDLRRRAVTRFATAQTRLGLGIGWQNKAGSSRLANVSTSTIANYHHRHASVAIFTICLLPGDANA